MRLAGRAAAADAGRRVNDTQNGMAKRLAAHFGRGPRRSIGSAPTTLSEVLPVSSEIFLVIAEDLPRHRRSVAGPRRAGKARVMHGGAPIAATLGLR
jgi:hypothetical protein